MSVKNTIEAGSEIVVNKEAWKELNTLVKEAIAGTPENKPKSLRVLTAIHAKVGEVKLVVNDKVGKIKARNEQIAELQQTIEALEASAANEPIANSFGLLRHISYYTDTARRLKDGQEPLTDTYQCYADVSAVASRIKPIVDGEEGVIGIKVVANETFGHVIMFSDLVGLVELRERRRLDVPGKPADAASIYVEGVTLAVKLADVYAQAFGAYAAIPVTTRHNNEDAGIPEGAEVAEDLEVEGDVEEEDEDVDTDGDVDSEDEDEDADPAEQIASEEDEEADELEDEE
jgi:hypothetical protein